MSCVGESAFYRSMHGFGRFIFFLCSVCFLQVFNVPIFIIPINLNGPKILSLNFCTSPTSFKIYHRYSWWSSCIIFINYIEYLKEEKKYLFWIKCKLSYLLWFPNCSLFSKSQQISASSSDIKQQCNETTFSAKWFSISESFSRTQINIDLHFALISRVCSIIQSPGLF